MKVANRYVLVSKLALKMTARLNGCPRNLILFLTEHMDKNNEVIIDKELIESFIEECLEAGVAYGVSLVQLAIVDLLDNNIIERKSMPGRTYIINPELYLKPEQDGPEYLDI